MRIGVFIDNRGISSVDCSSLLQGNPGIGGTAYSILLLCQVYKKTYPEDEIFLYATAKGKLPKVDRVVIVSDFRNAVQACARDGVDAFLIRPVIDAKPLTDLELEAIESARLKTVTWAHNFYDAEFAKKLARNPYISANVFVGKQEYDYYIDHEIIRKSTYIYNMYPMQDKNVRQQSDGKTVTYVGSLVKSKGFHILAKAWKSVVKSVPDAQLYVIGSGTLYSRDAKLGKYNIADEEYEKQFMPHLLGDDGRLLPSVHFLGSLGIEKDEYISGTSVGVVNPTGRTETFGISALDFESQGVPVVTIAYVGFLDTVKDNITGLLYKKPSQIAELIVTLLKDKNLNERLGKEGTCLAEKFVPELIVKDWNILFHDVVAGRKFEIQMPDDFMWAQFKWIRVMNRKLKDAVRMERLPAVVTVESGIKHLIRSIQK